MKVLQITGLALFVAGLVIFTLLPFLGTWKLDASIVRDATKEMHQETMVDILGPMYEKTYRSHFEFVNDFDSHFDAYNESLKAEEKWDQVIWDDYAFILTKNASRGPVVASPWLSLFLSIGLAVMGGMLYILPMHRNETAGIKNDGIYFSSMKARGWLGIVTGTYLIVFYIILYWYPEYLTNLVIMVDPLSKILSGGPASQWFLYGLIYTLAILVMGIRMFRKYRGNNYQTIRTISVMFFQLSFAFLIPEILVLFNMPWHDFKNIWPLDYSFFYEYRVDGMLNSGALGMFMLVWGIILIIIGVPVFTYFYGKRWYCSWV